MAVGPPDPVADADRPFDDLEDLALPGRGADRLGFHQDPVSRLPLHGRPPCDLPSPVLAHESHSGQSETSPAVDISFTPGIARAPVCPISRFLTGPLLQSNPRRSGALGARSQLSTLVRPRVWSILRRLAQGMSSLPPMPSRGARTRKTVPERRIGI